MESTPHGNCLLDNYRKAKRKDNAEVQCQKEDMLVTRVESKEAYTCTEGEMVEGLTIMATLSFNLGRHDFGWMVALDGGDALTGNCTNSTFLQEEMGDNVWLRSYRDANQTVGQLKWLEDKNGKVDKCVDIVLDGGQAVLHHAVLLDNMNVPCTDSNDDYNMDINICFSWRNSGIDDEFCSLNVLHPGKPTRCLCKSIDIPTSTVDKPRDYVMQQK